MVAIWTPCPGCEDFVCNVHHRHAYDCQCPDIDTFAAFGINPYETPVWGEGEGEAPRPAPALREDD